MRHPDYDGKSLSICAEREPSSKPDELSFACSRKMGHRGDHKAKVPGGRILVQWSQQQQQQQPKEQAMNQQKINDWFAGHTLCAIALVALTHPIRLYRGVRYGERS
jgi:hypothetical protein